MHGLSQIKISVILSVKPVKPVVNQFVEINFLNINAKKSAIYLQFAARISAVSGVQPCYRKLC
jgi:DNA-binding Lrp family transcriptional regulator